MFSFISQIGESSGWTEIATGEVLGWTGFEGIGGGLLAIWLGGRGLRKWPVLSGQEWSATKRGNLPHTPRS